MEGQRQLKSRHTLEEQGYVAGRCVAGDKVSHGATRNQMCCTVTGQGAGVAAVVLIKDDVKCSEVNVERLQGALRRQGVRLF